MNLPNKLLHALQSRIKDSNWTDGPRILALGADNNFLLVTKGQTAVWELDKYKSLSNLLNRLQTQRNGIAAIQNVVLHPYRFQCFVNQHVDGTLGFENLPPHGVPGIQAMVGHVMQDTKDAAGRPLTRQGNDKGNGVQKKPTVLQQRAQVRREWSDHGQEFSAQAKGMKVSLSLNVSMGGLGRILG